MSTATVRVPPSEGAAASESTVSLRQLGRSIRRLRTVWLATGLAGMLLGLAYAVLVPTPRIGSVAFLLSHAEGDDPQTAMALDASLASTRSLSQRVVDKLTLNESAIEFLKDVTIEETTPNILTVTIAAPSETEALERVTAYSEEYLAFRAEQVQATVEAQVEGSKTRAAELRNQIEQLTAEYNRIAGNPDDLLRATEAINERANLTSALLAVEQSSQAARLRSLSVIAGSSALDPPAVLPAAGNRQTALSMASGLIGGLAVGLGWVVAGSLVTDRLRSRRSVAAALGEKVRWSVGRLPREASSAAPAGEARRIKTGTPRSNRSVAVHLLEQALARDDSKPSRLAIAGVGRLDEVAVLTGSLAAHVAESRRVGVVDLTTSRRISSLVQKVSAPGSVLVHRPARIPAVARGPLGSDSETMELADCSAVLVCVDLDPRVGLEALATWTTRLVLVVKAGAHNAEHHTSGNG